MKIPLSNEASGLLSVLATVRIPGMRGSGAIKFFIDTGSPRTFIGENDCIKLQIPWAIAKLEDNCLMGGTSIAIGKICKPTTLSFITDSESIPIKLDHFWICKGNWKKGGLSIPNPSIIGNNLLDELGLILHHNPKKKDSYLYTE